MEVTSKLLDFLLDLPYLFPSECIPPLSVLNSILMKGEFVSGMGEDLEWKPFLIGQNEYEEIVEILTSGVHGTYFSDNELSKNEDYETWLIEVYSKYFNGAREVIDRIKYQE